MLGVTDQHVNLWVDCEPVKGETGAYNLELEERGVLDTTNGYVSVARLSDTPVTVPTSPSVDLQWMILSCDPARPQRANCDELPVSEVHLNTLFHLV